MKENLATYFMLFKFSLETSCYSEDSLVPLPEMGKPLEHRGKEGNYTDWRKGEESSTGDEFENDDIITRDVGVGTHHNSAIYTRYM